MRPEASPRGSDRDSSRPGLSVEVKPVDEVDDVERYDAFVIGSAAYGHHWLKEASAFVRRNERRLAHEPVWLFSSGPIGKESIDAKGRDVLEISRPEEFDKFGSRLHPRGAQVFFGAWDPHRACFGRRSACLGPCSWWRVTVAASSDVPGGGSELAQTIERVVADPQLRGTSAAGGIKGYVAAHPLSTYFILTFLISWGGMLLAVGPGGFPVPTDESETLGPFMVAVAGPAVAGVLLTAVVSGRAGLRDLLSRLLRWRVGARWYAAALLPVPLLMATVLVGVSWLFDDFSLALSTTDNVAALVLSSVVAGLMVAILEELGWTGFAIPRLRFRSAVLTTGLIVGLLWGAWHFPMFWNPNSFAAAVPFTILVARLFTWLPAFRVLMVAVYDRTGSVLVAALMHASLLAVQMILEPSTDSEALLLAVPLMLAAALWGFIAAIAKRGTLLRGSVPSTA